MRPHALLSILSCLIVTVCLAVKPSLAQPADEIFREDFEFGNTDRWPVVDGIAGPPCISGPAIGSPLAGDLGQAPAGAYEVLACVEITNDEAFERSGELAWSGVPMPRSAQLTDLDGLVLVGPGLRRLAAQFDVLSRWGGRVDDTALPVRWLEVSARPRAGANSTVAYELRRYSNTPAAAPDAFAASISPQGADFVVDTGLATFVLDPALPALFEQIDVDLDDDGSGRANVYTHTPGAGPRLEFDSGGGTVVLDTTDPARVSVDSGGFRIVESGPVKVVVLLKGHFSAPGGASLCSVPGVTAYERFGYTLVATFTRGSRDVGLQLNVRNECSDAFGGSWTDDAVTLGRASWEFPFPGLSAPSVYYAAQGAVTGSAAALTVVEQRKGAGNPWSRRARVRLDGTTAATPSTLDEPLVALADATLVAAVSMPWMRFREPQALAVDGQTLSLRFVSEPLVVGEAKGVWNFAKLRLTPAAHVPSGGSRGGIQVAGDVAGYLETLRTELRAELERGLLVRAPRDHVNDSRLFAGLSTGASSSIKTRYLSTMNKFHHDTVDPGGQWDRSKTFGSQLWPDVQFDQWAVDFPSSPLDNDGSMNYWNPSGAELFEYLRSGDPKWVWDFALPQSLLQMHTAYVNLGDHDHGNRNGAAATSGGIGEGQWHREAFGSDDYSYNMGIHLAYVTRPSPALAERFAQAGRMITGRYSIPKAQEGTREPFVSEVDINRQVIQHFEMLANCAEFVAGADGLACHNRLQQVVTELAQDNLAAGIMCQGDIPSAVLCGQPQKFMQNALMYHFFHRFLLNYGDIGTLISDALVGDPLNYYNTGMPKLGGGTAIDVNADWASLMECTLTGGATQVQGCSWVQNGDGNLLWHNKPHSVALMLMAHELDPSIGLCQVAKSALDEASITLGWQDYEGNDPGWWKGSAQMVQGMVFGVGLYDTCVDP